MGIGDLGPDAHRFLDFMADAGLKIWQMLPVGPTGYGDSPYQCFSAFAGNALLIHLPGADETTFPPRTVEFEHVIPYKRQRLLEVMASYVPDPRYHAFVAANTDWLPDYSLFMALKEAHGGVEWTKWEPGAARREPAAMAAWRARLATSIARYQVEQFYFFTQFHALKSAAKARGIELMGDLPIYVAHDSADVWANRECFMLDDDGNKLVQAGVPPDYFSATGQCWGNPIYNWEALKKTGYAWWVRRMRAAFQMFDSVRLDHFRGFEAYWEVPGSAVTAEKGRWVKGPGAELFIAIESALGKLPIVAENLGLITPEVEGLREQFGFPGMSILQFAFGGDGQAHEFKPHNFPRDRVAYTGTHDNDTTVGWWTSTGESDSTRTADEVVREKQYALDYLGTDGSEMNWTLIRVGLASVANTVLIPLQDILGTGSDTRMNTPGKSSGNWAFRFSWDMLTPAMTTRLRTMVDIYDR
jgi:4-alpha-glucanotransferase